MRQRKRYMGKLGNTLRKMKRKNTMYQQLGETTKAVIRGKYIALRFTI